MISKTDNELVAIVLVFRYTNTLTRYIVSTDEYYRLRECFFREDKSTTVTLHDGAELLLRLRDILAIQQELA